MMYRIGALPLSRHRLKRSRCRLDDGLKQSAGVVVFDSNNKIDSTGRLASDIVRRYHTYSSQIIFACQKHVWAGRGKPLGGERYTVVSTQNGYNERNCKTRMAKGQDHLPICGTSRSRPTAEQIPPALQIGVPRSHASQYELVLHICDYVQIVDSGGGGSYYISFTSLVVA
eukprot:scaffold7506_cov35-Attheya_sp.AAC.1